MSDDDTKWAGMVADLQAWGVTLEMIAEELGVSDRQVSNWKAGQRPTGMTAVKLYLLHGKHRRTIQGSSLHGAEDVKPT